MTNLRITLVLTAVSLCSSLLDAETAWPSWRGPQFTGVADGCNPPAVWSETQNIKWKTKLTGDPSSGSPIVWKDRVFFQSAVKIDQADTYKFNLVCLDRNTGTVLWEAAACQVKPHQEPNRDHGLASFSPVTDGLYIWAFFGTRGMYCFDFEGKLVWKQQTPVLKTVFGEAGSPALAEDAVIVCMDNEDESWIYAFKKATGEILWKNKRDEKTSWTTPIVVSAAGKLQVVTGASRIRSYDARTGELIWQAGTAITNGIATPVSGLDMVFCTSGGVRPGMVQAIPLYNEAIAPADANSVVWQDKNISPHIPSPLLYGQRLYVYAPNPARLSCFEAKTGKVLFDKQPLELFKDKNAYSSPVGAGDKIYITGRNGLTYVLKNADTFEVISTNQLDDTIEATPAVIDNEIILKGKQYIYCIAEAK